MTSIKDFMGGDHRHCDAFFAEAEQAVASQSWERASSCFASFQNAVLQHFSAEESMLFPAFEKKSGMYMGPTQVMRGEHVQMRELMDTARDALVARDADDFSGNAETLLIMMQQHNMKEENVLYPMCDQHLADELDTLIPGLQQQISR